MRNYKVIGRLVELHAGEVRLTNEQAAARASFLGEPSGRGKSKTYPILRPIQFKLGEVFAYDGEIPKDQASEVEVNDEGNVVEKPNRVVPTDQAVRDRAITAVLSSLDLSVAGNADEQGRPSLAKVSELAGFDVAAEELERVLAAGVVPA